MSLITLKPLDDGQKAVELPKGKTVIGRGPFLGCSDKKVSRNHAVLEVTNKDEVFLTPTHVNPCFYQPTADSPGQILKKDVPCKLENGDSFSLLPRAYRYQLNIDPSEQNEGKTNGSTVDHLHDGNTTNEEFGDTIVSEKAFCKEDNVEKNCTKEENTFSKRIAEIKGNDENNFTKNCDESIGDEPTQNKSSEEPPPLLPENECKENEDAEVAASTDSRSAETVEETSTKNNVSGEDKTEIETTESQEPLVASDHHSNSEEVVEENAKPTQQEEEEEKEEDFLPVSSSKTTTKKKLKEESYSKRRDKQAAKRKTALESAPKTKGRKKMQKAKFDDDGEEGTLRQPGRTSSRTNRQTRQGLSLEDFIVSDDDEWQSEPKRRRRKRQRGNDSGSDWEVDHKKPKKSSLTKVWSGSESGSETQKKKKGPNRGRRKKTKSSSEVEDEAPLSEEDEPQPSSSGEVKLNKTRIPCTFGKKCYRRNASHKDQFSHPGDSDYTSETETKKSVDTISESDGESAPPKKECPYGANCFRKNPQHKKDFKHTKNVRPQREAAKQADQKSKNCRNSDDYDLNDSFLNDDSDEYKPVDSGSDYESGEKTKKLTKVKGSSRKGGKKL